MKTILITGGRIIDPVQKIDGIYDLVIKDDLIFGVFPAGEGEKNCTKVNQTFDASGLLVFPGFIDMHVHLREPGAESLETIHSAARAAVSGGFTSIAAMPDTTPPVDNEASAEYVYLQADRACLANVYPIGALTKHREGKYLSEIGQLFYSNAVAFSDSPKMIADASVMYKALQYCSMFNRTVISHPEEPNLAGSGVMNAGYNAAILGLAARPASAEEIMISRDLYLSRDANAYIHFSPITTTGAVKIIRRAKTEGFHVTCSVTPHHLLLTDDEISKFEPAKTKVMPPLRTKNDIESMISGLQDGTIDAINSCHTPCSYEDKKHEYTKADYGVVGLETTISVIFSEFVQNDKISLSRFVELFSVNPAWILKLKKRKGSLEKGKDADVTLFDPNKKWVVKPENFKSKSRNTPFADKELTGKAKKVIVKGKFFDCDEV